MFDELTEKKPETTLTERPSASRSDHEDYLYRRAEQELELAQAATHPAVVKAHYVLAGHYLDGVYGPKDATSAEAGD